MSLSFNNILWTMGSLNGAIITVTAVHHSIQLLFQEHVVQMVLKLLSTFLPSDSGSDGRYVQHMPMLHALISGISSIDAVHILSLYGLVRILNRYGSTLFLYTYLCAR
jgi:hypothetical protein